MDRRTALNLGLLILAVLLALVTAYQPGLQKPPESRPLTDLAPGQVRQIRIERGAGDTVELVRRTGRWYLTAPVAARADLLRIERLLAIAQAPSLGRYPAAGQDLVAFGLAPPKLRLYLGDTELAFGDTEPLGHRRYVQTGPVVQLMADGAYYHLIGAYPTFVDPALLPEGANLAALELPGLKLNQARGRWQLTPTPANYAADAPVALARAWGQARARAVRAYTGAADGPDEVRIHLKGRQRPLRFVILEREPELVLGRPKLGIQYHLPAAMAKQLLDLAAH